MTIALTVIAALLAIAIVPGLVFLAANIALAAVPAAGMGLLMLSTTDNLLISGFFSVLTFIPVLCFLAGVTDE